MRQLTLDLSAPVRPTLDNFVIGANAETHRAVTDFVAGNLRETVLYLWGPAGAGKTHLLKSVADAFEASGRRTFYVGYGTAGAIDSDLAGIDLLAADDVERLDLLGESEFFNIYNTLRDSGRRLIAAGSAPPASLRLRADVVTRLGWGLVYQVHPLTDEEKVSALCDHARERGFSLTPDITDHLLNRVRRDMPTLLAVLDAIDRHSLEYRKPVTLALVRQVLRESGAVPDSDADTKSTDTRNRETK